MYKLKTLGHKTDPCGTPHMTLFTKEWKLWKSGTY